MTMMTQPHLVALAFLLAGLNPAHGEAPVLPSPQELRSDFRVNPLGVDRLPPALSWRMDAGGRAGAAQVAYRLVSASTEADLLAGKSAWDSGRVTSGLSARMPYAGPLPKAGERVWWRVKLWDEAGREGDWSAPAWFEAGLLDEAGWGGAQWIGGTQNFKSPEPVPAGLMGPWIAAAEADRVVGGFFVDVELPDKPVVSAMVYGGAGPKAGRGFVVVNYDQITPYNRTAMERVGRRSDGFVDMAFYLLPGRKNRIELRLAEPSARATATVGMRIVFADGTEMTVATDERWQTQSKGKPPGKTKIAGPYGGAEHGVVRQFNQTNVPPTWFRQGLTAGKGLVRARLYLCALGQGLAYVNGRPVDSVFYSSPQSDYEEFGYYTAHDITGFLQQGGNTLSVLLDGGWYHQVGGFGTSFSYGRPGLRAKVRLEYADGKSEQILSGPDWQWKEGAIRSANVYRGERVDYRIDHDEWKQTGTGTGWQKAQVIPPCTPKTVAMDVNPVRGLGAITPIKSWQVGSQTWLYDVGETIHGVVRLKFDEPSGRTIRFRYSEQAENGKLMNVPLSHWHCHGMAQLDEVIADGKPRVFEPLFTTKSFRYVEVSGLSKAPQAGDLIAIPVHTDAAVLSSFTSSDPMLNRLYQNGIRTFQNYVNHVTGDIPRERCLWGAESIYSIKPATYCFDWAPNHRLMNTLWWTGTMTKDEVPGQVGVGKRLTNMTQSFLWSATPLFLTSEIGAFYDDPEPMGTYYDKARHFVRFFEKTAVDGIPTPNLLADHAATPDVPRNKQDRELINAMFFFEIQNRFAKMADRLGKTDDADHARAYATTIREAVMKRYDAAKHTFGNGTHDSLALAYGVISDPAEVKLLAASLVGYYRANGHQFDGGFMSHEIYPMLSRYGYVEDAYEMLVNPDYAGPAWSVKTHDATTFYELYTLDREHQMKVGQNFFAFGHSTAWMITDLAGIRYTDAAPNGKRMILAPEVPLSGKLDQVTASLKTPMGKVTSAWTYKDEKLAWSIEIPANTSAEVRVPAEEESSITGTEGMKKVRSEAGAAIYEAAAGSYVVHSRLTRREPVVRASILSGTEKDWRVGKGSEIKVAGGIMTVTRGGSPTQILTTQLPVFSGSGGTLSVRMKTPATGRGGIRFVSGTGRKNTVGKAEFTLGPVNEWNTYLIPIPEFQGKPVSLWIELRENQEELQFSEIRLESGGTVSKVWNFAR
jgi:alpha-L-rhamnosidase